MCRHSEAMAGGTRDGVGGTPLFGKERRQPHSRIERSLSLSWFDRTAPESALSEMFVFDHTLIQTFVDGEYTDLWNRMPSAEEMEEFASAFLDKRKDRLKGLGWYCYRQAADNYLAWLHKDRFDESNADRWEVPHKISRRFFFREFYALTAMRYVEKVRNDAHVQGEHTVCAEACACAGKVTQRARRRSG